MDLDTAITLVRELGTNWARNGAPHQKDTGDALLLVVNAALEWQSLYKGPMPTIKPPTAIADAFTRAAQAAADHVAGGKPASIGRQQSERIVPALPLPTSTGQPSGLDALMGQQQTVLSGLGSAQPLDVSLNQDRSDGEPAKS